MRFEPTPFTLAKRQPSDVTNCEHDQLERGETSLVPNLVPDSEIGNLSRGSKPPVVTSDLHRVVDAWAMLPDVVKTAIMAMVQSTVNSKNE
jgi:hypothetical protein